jgi:hypothetical protein
VVESGSVEMYFYCDGFEKRSTLLKKITIEENSKQKLMEIRVRQKKFFRIQVCPDDFYLSFDKITTTT